MNLKYFKKQTNEEIKEIIITEFYLTGKVNGYYMKGRSKESVNPFKQYIRMILINFHNIQNNQETYIDDLYQMTFEMMWKTKADKFISDFFKRNGDFNILKFCATACRIVMLNGVWRQADGNPKPALVTYMRHGSSLDPKNCEVIPELLDKEQNIDEYLIDYINPDLVEEILDENDRAVYEKMLIKETKYYYNTVNAEYREFANKLREIKKHGL